MKINLSNFRPFVLLILFTLYLGLRIEAQTPVAKPAEKVISGGIVNGKAKLLPKPVYPESARIARIAGEVKIEVLIDETGKVITAKAVDGVDNAALRQASEAAALLAEFSPTRLSGKPVKVRGVITYNFVAPEKVPSMEEKVRYLTLSTFLTTTKYFANNSDDLRRSFEGEDYFADIIEDVPEFAAELREVRKFHELTPEKRIQAIDSALSAIRAKLGESDKWQLDIGAPLGDLFGPMFLLTETGADPSALKNLDETKIKEHLAKIAILSKNPPSVFPKEIANNFLAVGELSERENLMSDENFEELFRRIQALVETISPDEN